MSYAAFAWRPLKLRLVRYGADVPRNLFVLLLALLSSACAHVRPYERGRLANPRMDPTDASSVGQQHVRSVHEGAIGGDDNAVSGCGCN